MDARVPAALLVVCALAAGCGGSAPDDSVRAYFDAIAARDGDRACEQLSGDLRSDIERAQGSAGRSCQEVMQLAAGLNPSLRSDEIERLDVEVDENGDEAVARFRNPLVRRQERVELVREDGGWRIASLQTRPEG